MSFISPFTNKQFKVLLCFNVGVLFWKVSFIMFFLFVFFSLSSWFPFCLIFQIWSNYFKQSLSSLRGFVFMGIYNKLCISRNWTWKTIIKQQQQKKIKQISFVFARKYWGTDLRKFNLKCPSYYFVSFVHSQKTCLA